MPSQAHRNPCQGQSRCIFTLPARCQTTVCWRIWPGRARRHGAFQGVARFRLPKAGGAASPGRPAARGHDFGQKSALLRRDLLLSRSHLLRRSFSGHFRLWIGSSGLLRRLGLALGNGRWLHAFGGSFGLGLFHGRGFQWLRRFDFGHRFGNLNDHRHGCGRRGHDQGLGRGQPLHAPGAEWAGSLAAARQGSGLSRSRVAVRFCPSSCSDWHCAAAFGIGSSFFCSARRSFRRAMFCSWRIRSHVTPNFLADFFQRAGLLAVQAKAGVDDLAFALTPERSAGRRAGRACSCG